MSVPPRHHKIVAGFSLVEVVLALGLTAFSLVGMMGMLNIGFSQARQSADTTVQAYIVQSINAEAQLASTNLSGTFNGMTRYFDAQGREQSNAQNSAFSARTSLTNAPYCIATNTAAIRLNIEVRSVRNPSKPTLASRVLVNTN